MQEDGERSRIDLTPSLLYGSGPAPTGRRRTMCISLPLANVEA
jgi:hypothetical protein